ncbi:hypothetical protein KKA02_02675 [Patescibacteria group bacterium]|nr:hypothetical protein [Patescibacteria group bacterium]
MFEIIVKRPDAFSAIYPYAVVGELNGSLGVVCGKSKYRTSCLAPIEIKATDEDQKITLTLVARSVDHRSKFVSCNVCIANS